MRELMEIYDEIYEACNVFYGEIDTLGERLENLFESHEPIDYETAAGLMMAAGAVINPIGRIITMVHGQTPAKPATEPTEANDA